MALRIPKKIHQIWMDRDVFDNKEPPEKFQQLGFYKEWRDKHPDYEYTFWNKRMIYDLIDKPEFSKYKSFFHDKLKINQMMQSDFIRYVILYYHGGVYMDLDFKMLKRLDSLIEGKELQLYWEPLEHSEPYDNGIAPRLCMGFMCSAAKHPFLIEWMDDIMKHYTPFGIVHW